MSTTLKFGAGKWAAKAGSVLAYNDENNNFKPLPFTFTRASSATRVNESGLIESVASGVPRIDFLDNADGHLLLEPSRTNQFTYSQEFDNAAWSKTGITITANEVISPDGTQNADKLENSSNGARYISQSISLTSGTSYTYSAFFKKGIMDWCYMLALASTDISASTFDILNGVVGSTSNSTITTTNKIEDYGNGWYKCSITFTVPTTASYAFRLYNADSSTDVNTVTGSYSYIYGAQLEEGSYATSYIPTSGSSVTRVADQCNNAGNLQVLNNSEGVLYLETSALFDDLTNRYISISDGSSGNRISFYYRSTSNQIRVLFSNSQTLTHTLSDSTLSSKVAIKYTSTNQQLWVDGVLRQESNSSLTLSNLDALDFDLGTGSGDFYGKVKNIQVYNQALTDSQLAALTSL